MEDCLTIQLADLFCGAGGTSTGALQAIRALGHEPVLTAVNHWTRAVETHTANHPEARHYCASVDSLNPRHLFPDGRLDILWASPECTHHSRARGGKPMLDQSRATAWCVTRWAEALSPSIVMVENVPEFQEWGPLGSTGLPMQSRKGDTFRAWVASLESIGYRVDWRELVAADYGDPTTRRRLFVQAVRGKRRIVWPDATHAKVGHPDMFSARRPWVSARDGVIDWTLPAQPIADRKRPLAPKTMNRIREGLERYGGSPFVVAMEHGGRNISADAPLPTVTCAKGGAMGVAWVIEYYGNGVARPVSDPLPTVTCNDRFALIQEQRGTLCFRMLQPHELAAAQGFPNGYQFAGTKTEQVRQIGNAVPCGFSRALITSALTQNTKWN